MKPSQLIRQVHEREFERLAHWTGQYLPEREATDLARHAIVQAWTIAVAGENTRHGAIAFMQAIVTPRIRRLREIRGSYLPVVAPLTLRMPSYTDVNELADAYSLMFTAGMQYETDWTQRCDMQAWLHQVTGPAGGPRFDVPVVRSAHKGQKFLQAVAEALDEGLVVARDAYGYRDACRRREIDRSRRWLIAVTAHQRGAEDGSFEQVCDRSVSRQDESDDQVAGTRPARPAAPGQHEGAAD